MAAPNLSYTSHLADSKFQETWQEAYDEYYTSVPDNNILSAAIPGAKNYKLGEDGSVTFMVELSHGGSGGTVPDGARNVAPGRPINKKGKTKLVWHQDSFQIGGQTLALAENSVANFVDVVEQNYNALLSRSADDMERQANGDGRGILCVLSAVVGAPTYGVEKPYGQEVGNGTMLLREEMPVAVVSPAGVLRGTGVIDTFDETNETFTTTAAIAGAVVGDLVVRVNGASYTGTDLVHGLDKEANGVMQFTGRGDVCMAIDGAEHRRWNGVQMGNGGTLRPITEALVSSLDRRCKINAAGAVAQRVPYHYTSDGLQLKLAEEIAARLRTAGSTKVMVGGFEYTEINGTRIATSPIAPRGQYRVLDFGKKSIGKLKLDGPQGFIGGGRGKAALRYREDYNVVQSVFERPHNNILHRRSTQGVLMDLTDDNGYTSN